MRWADVPIGIHRRCANGRSHSCPNSNDGQACRFRVLRSDNAVRIAPGSSRYDGARPSVSLLDCDSARRKCLQRSAGSAEIPGGLPTTEWRRVLRPSSFPIQPCARTKYAKFVSFMTQNYEAVIGLECHAQLLT